MSGFQVGDVVVCVEADAVPDRNAPDARKYLTEGKVYQLTACWLNDIGKRVWSVRKDGKQGWRTWRFQKMEAADEQFTEQMRACKPQRVGEPA